MELISKINKLFSYDKMTGNLFRKVRVGRNCEVGRCKRVHKSSGYIVVKIDGKMYTVHRIAFAIMTGSFPAEIDHINGVKTDNRWENLRSVSGSENSRNRKLNSNNTSGVPGIYPKQGKWAVSACSKYIGTYSDFFEACCARKSAENILNFHPNHGRTA